MKSYYSFGQIEQDPSEGMLDPAVARLFGRAELVMAPGVLPPPGTIATAPTPTTKLLPETVTSVTPEQVLEIQRRAAAIREQALPEFRKLDTKFTLTPTPAPTVAVAAKTVLPIAIGALAALMLLK